LKSCKKPLIISFLVGALVKGNVFPRAHDFLPYRYVLLTNPISHWLPVRGDILLDTTLVFPFPYNCQVGALFKLTIRLIILIIY
jgi:hypothetical protein